MKIKSFCFLHRIYFARHPFCAFMVISDIGKNSRRFYSETGRRRFLSCTILILCGGMVPSAEVRSQEENVSLAYLFKLHIMEILMSLNWVKEKAICSLGYVYYSIIEYFILLFVGVLLHTLCNNNTNGTYYLIIKRLYNGSKTCTLYFLNDSTLNQGHPSNHHPCEW